MAGKPRKPRPDAAGPQPICRNVIVGGRRTSLRMEASMWTALAEICRRQGLTTNQIAGMVDSRRGRTGLTAAMRVMIINYFQAAAAPIVGAVGHDDAGYRQIDQALRGFAETDDESGDDEPEDEGA